MKTLTFFENRLLSELNYANNNFSKLDSIKIFLKCFNNASKEVGEHKIRGIKNSYKIAKVLISKKSINIMLNNLPKYFFKLKNYKKDKVLQSEVRYFTTYLTNLPKIIAISMSVNTLKFIFIKSNKERIEILKDILYWGTFAIVTKIAGGGRDLDFEGGLPDLDLKFGIGMHRNFLFHSILIVLGAEFVLRFFINLYKIFYKELPEEHLEIWDSVNTFINLIEESTISAMYMGVGIHFIVDSNILYGLQKGIKPLVGLPHMSMEMHKLFLLVNAGVSLSASTSILENEVYGSI